MGSSPVAMNNSVFGKTMENVRKHRDIKLVTTDKRRNQLVSEPNYHATKWFSEDLLGIEMEKIKVKFNKPVYLGLSILEISKTLMYEFWHDYIKPNYQTNCRFLSCHVRFSELIHTLLSPECQGTSYLKQAWNLKFKWLQLDLNLHPLFS